MPRLRPWSPERDAAAVLAAFAASADLHRQAPPLRGLDDAHAQLVDTEEDALAIDLLELA